MSNYDLWRLASPYEDSIEPQDVADFYGVEVDELTERHFANYHADYTDYLEERYGH